MIGSKAFSYINVLDKAADASWKRGEVISNNIANVNTPGYKRKDVEFESYLKASLIGTGSLDSRVANAKLHTLNPGVYTDYAGYSYRLDGNNVNIDTESANFAENQIRYMAILDSMTQEFNRLKMVLQK